MAFGSIKFFSGILQALKKQNKLLREELVPCHILTKYLGDTKPMRYG
jgi:hypothetical protein